MSEIERDVVSCPHTPGSPSAAHSENGPDRKFGANEDPDSSHHVVGIQHAGNMGNCVVLCGARCGGTRRVVRSFNLRRESRGYHPSTASTACMDFARAAHVGGPAVMGALIGAFVGFAHSSMTKPIERDSVKELGVVATTQLSYRSDVFEALMYFRTSGIISEGQHRALISYLERLFTIESYLMSDEVSDNVVFSTAKQDAEHFAEGIDALLFEQMIDSDVIMDKDMMPTKPSLLRALSTIQDSCQTTVANIANSVDILTHDQGRSGMFDGGDTNAITHTT